MCRVLYATIRPIASMPTTATARTDRVERSERNLSHSDAMARESVTGWLSTRADRVPGWPVSVRVTRHRVG
jgi:hypothetical protein